MCGGPCRWWVRGHDGAAALYNLDIYQEPINEYTDYLLVGIWIRPAITYGLVACFVTEKKED